MKKIIVPALQGTKKVTVGKTHVKSGDSVVKGQELFTIETKKGAKVVKADEDGIIRELLIKEGDEVAVGAEALIFEEADALEALSVVKIPLIPGAKQIKVGKINVTLNKQVKKQEVLLQVEGGKGNVSVKADVDGVIKKILVKEGEEVSAGSECIEIAVSAPVTDKEVPTEKKEAEKLNTDILIIGGGTGGYVSAIRASRAGKDVILIEKNKLGGTCLNVGCIPTKTLIASAHVYHNAVTADMFGIEIEGSIKPDMKKIIERKNSVVDQLVGGIGYLMEKNHVRVIKGEASFLNNSTIIVKADKEYEITFGDCIIATGSSVMKPAIEGIDGSLIMDSTAALSETELPGSVTIVGGGVIGLEFAFLYNALGVKVTVIEFLERLVSVMDADISEEILRIAEGKGIHTELGAKVTSFVETIDHKVVTTFEKNGEKYSISSDKVLVAIGRKSNIEGLGLENIDIEMNPGNRGIAVDAHMCTNVPHIYAVGDVNNRIQLAHAASYEGMIAVDHILGKERSFEKKIIPSVIFTMPEMASVGLNKADAEKEGITYKEGIFHYSSNGKALSMNETEGFIRILSDDNDTIIGATIIGADASTLIASLGICVANKMKVEDLEKTVFAHPTTAEVIHEAALDIDGGAYHE